MTPRIKIVTFLGTRPEIIRLSCVMALLDEVADHVIVHTGQNYDYELNQVFFEDLNVREPDHYLNVDTSSLGRVYGNILIASEDVLNKERPDAVLILGDTNSSIAGIMARRMKIPIYHMEAGNRCFDLNVPEEINRRIIDHISDFNLVYTEHARRHLLAEGIPHRRIYLSGSPMKEVLDTHLARIEASTILHELGLEKDKYLLVSAHREENVDDRDHLQAILTALEAAGERFAMPVIVSTHPRSRQRLEALKGKQVSANIRFLKPFGFLDYINLQMNACCVLSDSGTICEESAILAFPAITLRNSIERPEALDAGTIIMTGLDPHVILAAIERQISPQSRATPRHIPREYQIADTSSRVVNLILGTAKLSHRWDNIHINVLP